MPSIASSAEGIKVKAIVISIKGKDVELTPSEARDLKRELFNLLDTSAPLPIPYPYPVESLPAPRPIYREAPWDNPNPASLFSSTL